MLKFPPGISFLFVGALLVAPATAHAQVVDREEETPEITYPRVSGTRAGVVSLATGAQYVFASGRGFPLLSGQIEYQATKVLAVRVAGGIPLASGPDATTVIPGQVGGTLHLFPRSTLDPFLGGNGGLAIVGTRAFGYHVAPVVSVSAGLRIYLTNLLLLQVEGGYHFMQYAGQGYSTDLNAPFAQLQAGFYL